jgi:hypothetical protein
MNWVNAAHNPGLGARCSRQPPRRTLKKKSRWSQADLKPADYESGGLEFESRRARQKFNIYSLS